MSHRKEQVESMMRTCVQGILTRGLSDPRLEGTMLTVTEVSVSPDFANASIKVSVLPEKAQNRAVAALNHAAKHVRHEVGERLDMRSTPRLMFELDVSTKRQAEVFDALRKAREERGDAGEGQQDDAGGAPEARS